jgi:hypothetical protein
MTNCTIRGADSQKVQQLRMPRIFFELCGGGGKRDGELCSLPHLAGNEWGF